ncbi:MAG: hypothetical protein VX460_10270 [Planctomycetota bacterium]|nr:hypothetical protein [Planctomycetota bacterium]
MRLPLKILLITAVGGALLLLAGYVLVPPAARRALADGSRAAFGVPSTIGGVGATPGMTTTAIGFSDYRLEPPEGFTDPILTIDRFELGMGTRSLLGDTKEVSRFVLHGLVLTLEQDGVRNNLVPLLQHVNALPSATGAGHEPDAPQQQEDDVEERDDPRLRVGVIEIEGVAARLKVRGIPGVGAIDRTFAVPDFTADLGGRGDGHGVAIPELAGALVLLLKDEVLSAADGEIPPEVLTALETALEGGLEGGMEGALDALGSAAKQRLEDGRSAIEEAASKALGGASDEARSLLEKGLSGMLGGDGGGR